MGYSRKYEVKLVIKLGEETRWCKQEVIADSCIAAITIAKDRMHIEYINEKDREIYVLFCS